MQWNDHEWKQSSSSWTVYVKGLLNESLTLDLQSKKEKKTKQQKQRNLSLPILVEMTNTAEWQSKNLDHMMYFLITILLPC